MNNEKPEIPNAADAFKKRLKELVGKGNFYAHKIAYF
jgi:hypothetical protein